MMSRVCDICAELDCLLSFAEAARAYDYRPPTMTDANIIDIRQGRCDMTIPILDDILTNKTVLYPADTHCKSWSSTHLWQMMRTLWVVSGRTRVWTAGQTNIKRAMNFLGRGMNATASLFVQVRMHAERSVLQFTPSRRSSLEHRAFI